MQYKFALLLAFVLPAIVSGTPVPAPQDCETCEDDTSTPVAIPVILDSPTATCETCEEEESPTAIPPPPPPSAGNVCGSTGNTAVFCNSSSGKCTANNSGNVGSVHCCSGQAQQNGEWNVNSDACNQITYNSGASDATDDDNEGGGLLDGILGGGNSGSSGNGSGLLGSTLGSVGTTLGGIGL